MQIAVASGKGGTGKTTLSTSLALCGTGTVQYLDCDVEEPNGHIFLNPQLTESETVYLTIPEIIEENCTACGKCRDICKFNAIGQFGKTVMTFPDLCHSCLGCFLVCEENALLKKKREIGVMEKGMAGDIIFTHGRMRVGEAMAIPLLQAVKKTADPHNLAILDAPPGTSCPFVETAIDSDYVILITEPTPFGHHDLKLAAKALDNLGKPYGVIINRSDIGDDRVEKWCAQQQVPLLLKIPFSKAIAKGYAHGTPMITTLPELREPLTQILRKITDENK